MYCNECGARKEDGVEICPNCKVEESKPAEEVVKKNKKFTIRRIILIVVVIWILGGFVLNFLNSDSLEKNDSAVDSFLTGDTEGARNDLLEAKDSVIGGTNKVIVAMNLAYLESAEGNIDKAVGYFKEALEDSKKNSFKYYLILGEIAYLEGEPEIALENYMKSHQENSTDFQVNTVLALFFLDLEGVYSEFGDPVNAVKYAKISYDNAEPQSMNRARENLGMAYIYNENPVEALKYLKEVQPEQPSINFLMGLVYAGIGDADNAEINIQKALDGGFITEEELEEMMSY